MEIDEEGKALVLAVIDTKYLSHLSGVMNAKLDAEQVGKFLAGDEELFETIAIVTVEPEHGDKALGLAINLRAKGIKVIERATDNGSFLETLRETVMQRVQKYDIGVVVFASRLKELTALCQELEENDVDVEMAGDDQELLSVNSLIIRTNSEEVLEGLAPLELRPIWDLTNPSFLPRLVSNDNS